MSKTVSLVARLGLGIALLVPTGARALELGHLNLHSALGQKLKADIPLVFNTAPNLKHVKVGLASQDEFAGAGLAWTSMLDHIKFHTIERNGAYYVEVSSDRPVTQPYLQFLLRIHWRGGQLLREYTALLDPPYLVKQPAVVATPAVPAKNTELASAPVQLPQPAAVTPANVQSASAAPLPLLGPPNVTPVKPVAAKVKPPATPNKVGPLASGASLWSVAQQLKPKEHASIPQIAFALYRANPSAFLRGNMNGLKRGAVLRVPPTAGIQAVSRQDAVHALEVQSAAWSAFKAEMSHHPLRVASGRQSTGSASGRVGGAPAGTGAPQRLLKIVGAGAPGALQSGNARSALRRGTASLQEELASSQLENGHLEQRLRKLKQQLDATKRLLAVENKELAELQAQFKPASAPVTVKAGVKKAPVPPPAASTVPHPQVAHPQVAPQHVPAPVVRRPLPAPIVAPPETSLVDEIMASPLFVPVAGAVALLLLGFALYYRRRRQSIAEFEESILSGRLSDTDSGTEDTGKQGEASFLSDFSQGGMGNIHTDEVDPIAEAEVYLAYQRDEQAEEILKEAIQKDSMRHELRLRLLEIYHQRKDVRAFETMAEELYAALEGKGGRIWSRVEELGRKLSPENPLFRRAAVPEGAASTAEPVPAMPDRNTVALESDSAPDTVTLQPTTGGEAEDSFSFSLDMPQSPSFASAAADDGHSHDDPDTTVVGDAGGAVASGMDLTQAEAAAPSNDTMSSIEFDLDLASTTVPGEEPVSEDALKDLGVFPAPQGENLEWALEPVAAGDMEDGSAGAEPGGMGAEEADTKLDLAKAYIDMGDADGARGILKEVLAEGNDHQKQEARRLESTLV
ncbi:MAG: FimV/HubP family polar landmark protein [Acidiferrobacteraceae bacterium]